MIGPRLLEVNGVETALWTQAGEGPPVLLCHATGFHACCWDQIVKRLPGRPCYALDFRGHGRSAKPAPPYSWRTFGEDLAALCREIDLRGAIGVGHSMGGHAVTLAAAMVPSAFSALVLVDPVILTPESYRGVAPNTHFARKRRNRWQSPDEMFERFREREPFQRWDPAVLRDYCDYGLLPATDGDGFVLACPPEVEASIYENSGDPRAAIFQEIAEIEIPVEVIRAFRPWVLDGPSMDMIGSPTVPDLASRFRHGHDLRVERSHFIPLEDPQLIADEVAKMAGSMPPRSTS